MNWLGLDIGGANLKAADGCGWARSIPFPLWREPGRLPAELTALVDDAPASDGVAVTMTGELCDCFRSKVEGVLQIVDAVEQAAGARPVLIYLVDGRLVSPHEARQSPELAAASNWYILARFAGRFAQNDAALLMDVGSTTADLVPLVGGQPRPRGFNDTDRLLTGELVYGGVLRTPICAVTTWLPWQGQRCPVAAELFATTGDAYVVLGDLPEQPDCIMTADGRPRTKDFARHRLARMICADRSIFSEEDARIAASRVQEAQLDQLRQAAAQVAAEMPAVPQMVVASGVGEFLAAKLALKLWPHVTITSLRDRIGRDASQCAPAYALAVFARENCPSFLPETTLKSLTDSPGSSRIGDGG